ncbi:MAG: PQQ-dependent sugar dehydrogenase [Acidimicrobiales bacterium]
MRRALVLATILVASACSGDPGDSSSSPFASGVITTSIISIPSTAAGSTAVPLTNTNTTAAGTTAPPATAAPTTLPTGIPTIALAKVADLVQPVAVGTRVGDNALYVAERTGTLRKIVDNAVVPEPVIDISARTQAGGERGFLGFAFAPDGAHLYVNYTDLDGNSNVDEFAVAADGRVDSASRRRVLFQTQPYANHNGGDLVFGPDGLLYIGFGDGGSGGDPQNNAQNLGIWLGKMLRIDPRANGRQAYTVPGDNPFVATAGALPEIWSYGLRNPWRYSFDSANGDLWIGDVGQNAWEEIDWQAASAGAGRGVNFGWRRREGTHDYNTSTDAAGAVDPIFDFSHANACSVTGGVVYHGAAVPSLAGTYLFGDYCHTGLWGLRLRGTVLEQFDLGTDASSVVSFGTGPDGELYVCSIGGTLYRIVSA